MSTKYVYELLISGLNETIGKELLVKTFERYGWILECKISVTSKKEKTLTIGSITYGVKDEAKTAMKKMNGQILQGCKLKIKYSKKPNERAEKNEVWALEVQNLPVVRNSRGVKRIQSNETEAEHGGKDSDSEFSANKKRDYCGQTVELQQKALEEYAKENYGEALKLCNEAINSSPYNPELYLDRSLCYMMLNEASKALEDARESLKLNDRNFKAYELFIKCCLITGNMAEAGENLKIAVKLGRSVKLLTMHNDLEILKNEFGAAKTSFSSKNYNRAVNHLNGALIVSPNCIKFFVMKAECLALMKMLPQALVIVNKILRTDEKNPYVIYVRGLCSYYVGNIMNAVKYFHAVLKLAPKHPKAYNMFLRATTLRKLAVAGQNAIDEGRFQIAIDCFSTAQHIDDTNDAINNISLYNKAFASFKLGLLKDSIKDCTEVLERERKFPKAIYLRAECFLSLKEFEKAARDYKMAIDLQHCCPEIDLVIDDLKDRLMKAHKEVIKSYMMGGEIRRAALRIDIALEFKADDEMMLQLQRDLSSLETEFELAKQYYANKEFHEALSHVREVMKFAPNWLEVKIMKSECLALTKECQKAREIIDDILGVNAGNADAIYVLGICFYYEGDLCQAISCLRKAYQFGLKHPKVIELHRRIIRIDEMNSKGIKAVNEYRFYDARKYYTIALGIDPSNDKVNAVFHFNRALASFKIFYELGEHGHLLESIDDCTRALRLEKKYLRALLGRATCYMSLKQYAEALRDYEMAYEIQSIREIEVMVNKAKLLYRQQSERPDFHAILGVNKPATFAEIRKAYHKKALEFHPDRHANVMPAEKRYFEAKFREVKKAFDSLAENLPRTKN